jgi:hypothetical protein
MVHNTSLSLCEMDTALETYRTTADPDHFDSGPAFHFMPLLIRILLYEVQKQLS